MPWDTDEAPTPRGAADPLHEPEVITTYSVVAPDNSNWIIPKSAVVITKNSRGYNYELKLQFDTPEEAANEGLLLAKQFDDEFRREFGGRKP